LQVLDPTAAQSYGKGQFGFEPDHGSFITHLLGKLPFGPSLPTIGKWRPSNPLTIRFLFAYNLAAMSQLFKVSFRAHLVPEGFACPATVVTVADTAQEAIERAARWFSQNQPYYAAGDGFHSASLDNFEAEMLPYFFCYGIGRPLLWEFPRALGKPQKARAAGSTSNR
jgi:hypothetical protein